MRERRSEGTNPRAPGILSWPNPLWGLAGTRPSLLPVPSLPFLSLPPRTSHSRAKAEAALTAAQKAQEEARIARIAAKEFSPSFQHRENGESGRNMGWGSWVSPMAISQWVLPAVPLPRVSFHAGACPSTGLGTCLPHSRARACAVSAPLLASTAVSLCACVCPRFTLGLPMKVDVWLCLCKWCLSLPFPQCYSRTLCGDVTIL